MQLERSKCVGVVAQERERERDELFQRGWADIRGQKQVFVSNRNEGWGLLVMVAGYASQVFFNGDNTLGTEEVYVVGRRNYVR